MSTITFYHNPRCSKSRQALQLLRDKGVQPEVIEYLKTPPDVAQLSALKDMLGVPSVRDFMRTKEQEYKDQGLKTVDDEQTLLKAVAETPKLMERPIAVKGRRAIIGRPPENVLELL